jgi:hypothetical protein
MTAKFEHVLDRHGLWDEARTTLPRDEFGPCVNLGLFQLHWWNEGERMRRFIRSATRADLATFMALLAAIGREVVDSPPPEMLTALPKGHPDRRRAVGYTVLIEDGDGRRAITVDDDGRPEVFLDFDLAEERAESFELALDGQWHARILRAGNRDWE